jgi:hypothetical protein
MLLLSATALAAAPRGRVTGVSAKRAYLDAGKKQGLALGQSIQLTRNGKPSVTCKIDQLADRTSACATASARVGDSFALQVEPAAPAAPKSLPPPPSAAELQAAADALVATPVEKVDFKGTTGALSRSGATLFTASVGHLAWVNFAGSDWQQERIELQLNGLDIHWAGFRAYAHVVALFQSLAPANRRFRPGDVAQVNVWELALSSREVGRSWTVSVGRVWPHHTPGLALLDGLQAGWRSKEGTAEVGVYGGMLPNAMTLYPQLQPWTAGLYYGHTIARGRKSALRLLQTEGRVGVRGTGPGPQLEVEWAMLADFARYVDLGAQARVSLGAGDWTRFSFDSARVTLGIRPYDRLRINASFRYLGPVVADYDNFATGLFSTNRAYHGTLDLVWDPRPWIALSLMGGTDWELDTGAGREYFGPELGFPRLLGQRAGMAVGYREELGWYAGRQAYVTFRYDADERVHLLLRVSYFEDRLNGSFTDPSLRELGLYFFTDVRLARWLRLRASLMARVGVDGYVDTNPAGINGRLELIGTL